MAEEAERSRRETLFYLRRGIDYFDFFRRGQLMRWNDDVREAAYMQFPIPVNEVAQPDAGIADPDQPIPTHQYVPFRRIRRTDDGAGRTVPEDLRRNIESIGWRMVKILGAGSQGLAVLFESVDDGSKAVFKYGTEIFTSAIEMWAMRQMVGARHIIQVRFHSIQVPFTPDFQ